MSHMSMVILDADRAINAQPHASFVHVLIPALSDDPETIEELRHAIRRFLTADDPPDPLATWSDGCSAEPHDAGICIVDLPARMIIHQSSYTDIQSHGMVTNDDDDDSSRRRARWTPFHLADDWLITDDMDSWELQAQKRRQERTAPRFDARSVLYGKVAEFLVDECFAARGGTTDCDGAWTPPPTWQWRELPNRAKKKTIAITDGIAEIHARWLMIARDDLAGQSPRDLLLARRDEIERQLLDREMQWSNYCECPQPLWRESAAYRYAGFGTHEIVVYYELVRHLLNECWDLVVEPRPNSAPVSREAAIDRIGMLQQEWLHMPQPDYSNKSPAQVIECERLRIPMGVTGEEAMVDCDCPLCQMMADSDQPTFWHLDGCNLDDDFPFSPYEKSRADWESDRGSDEEHDEHDEVPVAAPRPNKGLRGTGRGERIASLDDAVDLNREVWQRSLSRSLPGESPAMSLFGLGCHLAELIDGIRSSAEMVQITGKKASAQGGARKDKKAAGDSQAWIDNLNRSFANLRQAVAEPGRSLVSPVVAKFTEQLLALAEARPQLRAKCLDLDRQLFDFVQRLEGAGLDGPF